jgi:hypothetical protein
MLPSASPGKFVRFVGAAFVLAVVFLMSSGARATADWSLEIANHSDSCAHIMIGAPISGAVSGTTTFDLASRTTKQLSGEATKSGIKVYASIGEPKCQQPYRQPGLFLVIPNSGKSELSIHKESNGSYAMRQDR